MGRDGPARPARMGALLLGAGLLLTARTVTAQEMALIPAGTFTMGTDDGEADERPAHRVTLPAFLLDRYEVNQAHYRRCVAAGACPLPRYYTGSRSGDLPVVGVSWTEAQAFCLFAGKRLPTEAEWEYAARGSEGRTYPWGEDLSCGRANFGNYAGAGICAEENPGRIVPIGSRPTGRTPEGVSDLGGNVWEWVADAYAPYQPPSLSPSKIAPKDRLRVVRGGSCCSYFVMPRAANRLAFPPEYRDQDLGFRCARDAPSEPSEGESSSAPRPSRPAPSRTTGNR